jgi:putative flippase GtrA
MFLSSQNQNIKKFLRFILVGSIAVMIQYGMFYLLGNYFIYRWSFIISYTISFIVNYILTTFYTFQVKRTINTLIKFISGHIINFILQWVFLETFVLIVNSKVALILSMMLAFPINFMILKFLLNKEKKND